MLLHREESCLFLIDVQEKLTPKIFNVTSLTECCSWLLRLAGELRVPIIASEQYPQGLGQTIAPLQNLFSQEHCVSKLSFSAFGEPNFVNLYKKLNKSQCILFGIETHVCVLQTAMEMLNIVPHVYVVVDAVGSRHEIDHQYGLKRMQQAGINLITAEMVFFEWLRAAGTQEFKTLSQKFLI